MRQAELFSEGEGDKYYLRNKDKSHLPDPVLDAIEACQIRPRAALEIGCGNGWRLKEIQDRYQPYHVAGYDPSEKAVKEKIFQNVFPGDAIGCLKALSYIRKQFYNVVIFGFCLYLVDREDLLLIAGYTDRILQDGGHIIIHDFWPPDSPHRIAYKHQEGVWSYHMSYAGLWTGHPAYTVKSVFDCKENVAVFVLQKNTLNAFPERAT